MKRKVIQIADSTQLVSIPRQWSKKHNIKKGDELEVIEKDNMLEICTEKRTELTEIEIDVSGLDKTTLVYAIRSAYCRGFDVIKVRFTNKTTIHYRTKEEVPITRKLQEELQRWVGMQIIEQKPNLFVYKNISNPSFEDFDLMFRRTFLLLTNAIDEFLQGAKEGDAITLESIQDKYNNLIIFIMYCLRLINKTGFSERYKNTLLYLIISNLYKIADIMKYAARDIIKLKKLDSKTLHVLELTFTTVRMYYDLFYKFEFQKLTKIYERRDVILRELEKIKKTISLEELILLVYSRHLLELIVSNLEATATYHLEERKIEKKDQ